MNGPSPDLGLVDVDISIVSHKNQALVRRCLRSLPGACASITWRASVVENLPRTGPALTDEFPWVRVITNPAPAGFGQNHNAVLTPVVRLNLARHVLVLNDDTELAPGSVSALICHADRDPSLGAVGPLLESPSGQPQHSFYAFPTVRGTVRAALRPGRLTCEPITSGPGWLGGACLLVRADAVGNGLLFDPKFFMFFEDTDLGVRLSASGWRIEVCAEASVVHFDHQTVSQPEMRHEMHCQMLRSSYLYFRKHHSPAAAWTVALACRSSLLLRGLRTLGKSLLRRNADERASGRDLLRLARYRPTVPLRHESSTPLT